MIFTVVLGLNFFQVWIGIQFIDWNKAFYGAIEDVDATAAITQLFVFAYLTGLSAGTYLVGTYLRKHLGLMWRERLTQKALDAWVNAKAYWYLRPGMSPDALDNPDQRIAEDCRKFFDIFLVEGIELISEIVALFSLVSILWGLSNFPLAFQIFGHDIVITHYLVWLAFVYVALSSVITHLMGKPLKSLVFRQERREADFRAALLQLSETAEDVAQSQGELAERRRLDLRFAAIKRNFHRLIGREFVLGLFSRPYFQTVLRIPLFLCLPGYFAGALTFGGLMQVSSAFGRVVTNLSWFIFSYRQLAELAAVAQRLDDLFNATNRLAPHPDVPVDIHHTRSSDGALHVKALQLATPEGRWLDCVPDQTVHAGECIWISGASGKGKSTLLKALAGLWIYGQGEIKTPNANMQFLSQSAHVSQEGLYAAACYPMDPKDVPADDLNAALQKVGLGLRLTKRQQAGRDAAEGLSLGEQQRLAFARLLIAKPEWIIMDEPTSSLDREAEQALFSLLRAEVPNATILCVSHRAPNALNSDRTWQIGHVADRAA
ncbi:ABC transporter ATP-binding protein/permease [Shimia sp. R10_1]|uniref:ABC transporter ATP-binding protein/permease n=1 Tax=Shimia sp. R10_1 TaxID=2821095 RepID=UPI001AD952A5|nr:ABC transporter ATP-binding protein/permease [Shimia sp. R10_1]